MDIFKKEFSNPFNWTGSKHRYLREFFSVLPQRRGLKVLDVFTGGGDLISKLPKSWKITANDAMPQIIELHKGVQGGLINRDDILHEYNRRCLSSENREGYLQLREEYNLSKDPFLLYLLMTNSFNNQLRFNGSGGFNMPFGKDRSTFNKSMQRKLDNYSTSLNEREVIFKNSDYKDLDFTTFDLLLLDPPYSNTCATYNESTQWGEDDDVFLFEKIDSSGKDFIYFNQTWSKGVENRALLSWMGKYNHIVLKDTTSNCNHQRGGGRTEEVMVYLRK